MQPANSNSKNNQANRQPDTEETKDNTNAQQQETEDYMEPIQQDNNVNQEPRQSNQDGYQTEDEVELSENQSSSEDVDDDERANFSASRSEQGASNQGNLVSAALQNKFCADVIKRATNNRMQWGNLNESLFNSKLVSKMPFANPQTNQLQHQFAINFHKDVHLADLQPQQVTKILSAAEVEAAKYFTTALKDLTEGDKKRMIQNVMIRAAAPELNRDMRQRGFPDFQSSDNDFLLYFSVHFSFDCDTHIKPDKRGLVRHPMIQNNQNHLDFEALVILDRSKLTEFVDSKLKGATTVYTKTMKDGRLHQQRLERDANREVKDTMLVEVGKKDINSYPLQLHGAIAHKTPDLKQASGCLDLYSGHKSNSLIQVINALIGAVTAKKLLTSGILHANGLMIFKLLRNPNSHKDGSVQYLMENLNKPASIDIDNFANIPLTFVNRLNADGKILEVMGHVKLRTLFKEEFQILSSGQRRKAIQVTKNILTQAQTFLKDLGEQLEKDKTPYGLRKKAAAEKMILSLQETYVNRKKERVNVQCLTTPLKDSKNVIKMYVQHIFSSKNMITVSEEQKAPSINMDQEVYRNDIKSLIDYGSKKKWHDELKLKKLNLVPTSPLYQFLVVFKDASDRNRIIRLVNMIRHIYKPKDDQELVDIVQGYELERVQVTTVEYVPATTQGEKNMCFRQQVQLKLLISEFGHHVHNERMTTQKRVQDLQDLLKLYHESGSEEDFKKWAVQAGPPQVRKITRQIVQTLYNNMTLQTCWAEHIKNMQLPDLTQEPSPRKKAESVKKTALDELMEAPDDSNEIKVIKILVQQRSLQRGPIGQKYKEKLEEITNGNTQIIESGFLLPLRRLQQSQNIPAHLDRLTTHSLSWGVNIAVLLLDDGFFSQFLDYQYPDCKVDVIALEELEGDEKAEKAAIDFIKFATPLIHYFLWQNGVKLVPEDFKINHLTTTFFCNFLLQYAQIDVRDSAKYLDKWIDQAFDDDVEVLEIMIETKDAGNPQDPRINNLLNLEQLSLKLRDEAINLGLLRGEQSQYYPYDYDKLEESLADQEEPIEEVEPAQEDAAQNQLHQQEDVDVDMRDESSVAQNQGQIQIRHIKQQVEKPPKGLNSETSSEEGEAPGGDDVPEPKVDARPSVSESKDVKKLTMAQIDAMQPKPVLKLDLSQQLKAYKDGKAKRNLAKEAQLQQYDPDDEVVKRQRTDDGDHKKIVKPAASEQQHQEGQNKGQGASGISQLQKSLFKQQQQQQGKQPQAQAQAQTQPQRQPQSRQASTVEQNLTQKKEPVPVQVQVKATADDRSSSKNAPVTNQEPAKQKVKVVAQKDDKNVAVEPVIPWNPIYLRQQSVAGLQDKQKVNQDVKPTTQPAPTVEKKEQEKQPAQKEQTPSGQGNQMVTSPVKPVIANAKADVDAKATANATKKQQDANPSVAASVNKGEQQKQEQIQQHQQQQQQQQQPPKKDEQSQIKVQAQVQDSVNVQKPVVVDAAAKRREELRLKFEADAEKRRQELKKLQEEEALAEKALEDEIKRLEEEEEETRKRLSDERKEAEAEAQAQREIDELERKIAEAKARLASKTSATPRKDQGNK